MSTNRTSLGIKSWPETERPRERLISQGPQVLSDAELLAVLMRNGTKGRDAISLSRDLITQFNGLRGLFSASIKDLGLTKGLGTAKIATLLAAVEITKRLLKADLIGKHYVRDPQSVLNYLMYSLRDRTREVFKVLFLNKANRILDELDLFEGTVDQASVHSREVVKAVLERHATAILLCHNHPSGRTEPSPEDRQITQKLSTDLAVIGVTLLDHIIVGDNQFFSFREQGLL